MDTIKINDVEWAAVNMGTDIHHPYGKLYTLQEALQLQDELWRLPTKEEANSLKRLVRTPHDLSEIKGTWVKKGKQEIFFPWNFTRKREGFLPYDIGAYWTSSVCDKDLQLFYIFEIASYFWIIEQGFPPFKAGVRLIRNNIKLIT